MLYCIAVEYGLVALDAGYSQPKILCRIVA